MMKANNIVKDGIHLGDIGSIYKLMLKHKDFQLFKIFVVMELVRAFIKNLMFCIKEKEELEKNKNRNDFYDQPMINLAITDKTLNDGWTAVTKDKSLSAQFEHTIGVTNNGCEIFTQSNKIDKI